MPSVPFLGSLFGTKAADASKMTSYPDKRSDDEWRAVLNKGKKHSVTHSLAVTLRNNNNNNNKTPR